MNVASLELCKELYELSGWDNTTKWRELGEDTYGAFPPSHEMADVGVEVCPAYDLGYLLRKLPAWIEPTVKEPHLLTIQPNPIGAGWNALYRLAVKTPTIDYKHAMEIQEADTPEDATCKLAIELFKQGLLK